MNANQLRAAFTGFFHARNHLVVPSASLIPHDPTVLFTIAGMVPFKPYFLGEERPPAPRVTTVQKCFRTNDIDVVGSTTRHNTFFEMLGNFSFGDYFKADAIPYAWEFVTGALGLDGERIWVTVHHTDDEAAEIWLDVVGVPNERLQRMGDDNFWSMGETGPCGPSSELYYDRGDGFGPAGGPAQGGEERYVEAWNLVFMQSNRQEDGTLVDLPRKNIDTGAGLERLLAVVEDVPSIFETDVLAPLVETAESLTGRRYGADQQDDIALRILADHGRAMTLVVSDGVIPSNEGRGYVLRRVIRRAVVAARRLGFEGHVTGALAATTAEVMGEGYPELRSHLDAVEETLEREERGFDRTLRTGMNLLEEAWEEARSTGAKALAGELAFRLHDTHGFPIELTVELSKEHGVDVDREGFERAMEEQRQRARQAARHPAAADESAYRDLLDHQGPTNFLGYEPNRYQSPSRVVGVLAGSEAGTAEIFLDRTPFYAEGGGQVGDTGTIVTETGRARVYDTLAALPGLISHRARIEGEILVGQDALAAIEPQRRESLRRNHTGTHLLHAALREVLGDHVRQQSSLVAPDRLRFDFSHHGPLDRDELRSVLEVTNQDVVSDEPVVTTVTTRKEAEAMGALAFFGDKYGEEVRVVRAGPHSLEFCGGTHVNALGAIGPVTIVSEGSIGANTRRIEAMTGLATVRRSLERDALLQDAATLLRTEPENVLDALQRLASRQRNTERELQSMRARAAEQDAAELAGSIDSGIVIARRDGLAPDTLRSLAQSVQQRAGARAVVLGGSPDGKKAALAVASNGDLDAVRLVRQVAPIVGGGGGGSPHLALAGGKAPDRLDDALVEARRILLSQ